MRSEPRGGREPVCPFCRSKLEKPSTITISAMESALGGTCGTCGALFIVDPTGKGVGEAMMQALGIAAGRLSKDTAEMVPGVDYEDEVLSYDWRTHRSSGVSAGYMDGYGRLYIIKIKTKPG